MKKLLLATIALYSFSAYCQTKKTNKVNWQKVSTCDTLTYKKFRLGIIITTKYEDSKDSSVQSGFVALISKQKSKWYVNSKVAFSIKNLHKYSNYKLYPEYLDINSDGLPELFLFLGYGATDSYRYFDIYTINLPKKKIIKVQYKDEIANPIYNKTTKLLQLNNYNYIVYTKLINYNLVTIKRERIR